jgi:hypothetical protein
MSMFHPTRALEVFRAFLDSRGLQEATLSVPAGFVAMLDFYRDMQATDCTFKGADMLLFQWGTYDRSLLGEGSGEAFNLGLTRQLIISEEAEDDDIWQLALTFQLEPGALLRALGNSHRWCCGVDELPGFYEHVLGSAAFTAGSQLPILRTTLTYGCAG